MTLIENAYEILFTSAACVLGILLILCLVRCVRGPEIADRIVAVNMAGTVTMFLIAVVAVLLNEGYLADVEWIYALLSFLAVVLLTKVYFGALREKKGAGRND